jgi:hypothetical protein
VLLEDFALPDGAEADYLIQGLARLIELQGAEPFVAAPLLLAEPRYFPEAIASRAEGVATLLRRLLAYAGLSPTRIDVEIYDEARSALIVDDAEPHAGAAAWFMGIADGVYRFGVRESELRDEQALIGTLGHEVAHAYRSEHRLMVPTTSIEEQLTDLTTVYLGFGAFTLESSFQFKTGGYDQRGEKVLYERQGRGYLRPGQLAYLLGVQLTIRGLRDEPVAPVLASLSDNQRAAVEEALRRLAPERDMLAHSLGLPGHEHWAEPHSLSHALVPLPDTEVSIHDAPRLRREQPQSDAIAFRLAGTRSIGGGALGLMSGFSIGALLNLELTFWPLTLGLSGLGLFLGKRRPAPTCTACARVVGSAALRCRNCSAKLVGDIGELADVFAAEDRYRQASKPSRRHVACPFCAWQPHDDDVWLCDCGHEWHTFDSAGRCPACHKTHETTSCHACIQESEHDAWYRFDGGAKAKGG